MRHVEPGLVDHLVPVDEQVEVDVRGPQRSPRTRPSERSISSKQVEERPRRQRRLDRDGAVQERRLIDDADRVRLAELGDGDHLDAVGAPEQLDRPAQRLLPRSEVRADPDVRERHARVRSTTTAA